METKLIFNPAIARKLLKMGNIIVDLKPLREDKEKTIFVFEYTNKLKEDLKKI